MKPSIPDHCALGPFCSSGLGVTVAEQQEATHPRFRPAAAIAAACRAGALGCRLT
jgi:hypothetical protein